MMANIFYDPSGRRSLWAKRVLGVALLAILLAAAALATSVAHVPQGSVMTPFLPRGHARAFLPETRRGAPRHHSWLPASKARSSNTPLNIGFYVPDDEASISSLRRNIQHLDWVVPLDATVVGPQHQFSVLGDTNFDRLLANTTHSPLVMPMVQNAHNGQWDGIDTAALLRQPQSRAWFARQLATMVGNAHASGIVLDLESLPQTSIHDYLTFIPLLRQALPAGSQIALTVPADDPSWPLAAFGKVADHVILMAYDQHWAQGQPGPIAAQDWFVRQVEQARAKIGEDKLIVALGNYAYDWHGKSADGLSVEEAWLEAHDNDAPITFDKQSGNPGFAFTDDDGAHTVWMLDAATAWNEMQALKRLGIDDIALWRLGTEDPGFWSSLKAFRQGGKPDLSRLQELLNSDVEGSGEILRITSTPTDGLRSITFERDALIGNEQFHSLPTPTVVQRTGSADPKAIALTFDDGPDGTWTPQILDILERKHVPGTFFMIGENALAHPEIVNRIVDDGGEIGNHTYTHPNLAKTSDAESRLEINATQRVIEAYTGRRLTLFRAPYFGDAEPTTEDELAPALIAQKLGYTIVGLHADAEDWQRPGVAQIIKNVMDSVHSSNPDRTVNVVLLHDGGGDRAQTVAALPIIIDRLRAEGYHFVPASALAGIPQSAAMPVISGSDLVSVRIDAAIFLLLAGFGLLLSWIFYVAITLGIARAIIMAVLAWWQSRRRRADPPTLTPQVSVIIPAYNEERVIASSVARVLASDYPSLEVIVADDGSKDRTSAIVAEAFAGDPRVTLMTLQNGGKASALNRAMAQAKGEVIIALDADTQFEPTTIRRLARWFADPQLGAVAGDARVGNRVNLVTRWQAIEYITAQNLERRALAGFDAMTVVPGAVGAWRRKALDEVGGYPEDTLAEDQDLTIAIQRAGWTVTYDPRATAWTEAPESFKALAKQRYRWAFGTLQCLWKHRAVLRKGDPAGLAWIGMPQAWAFQIVLAAVSPLIDLALVLSIISTILRVMQHGWAQTSGDVSMMGLYWLAFTAIDMICGWVAYRLDGHGQRFPGLLLIAQRIVYRQVMYWVVLRAIASAIGGWTVGWGKLERSGRVAMAQDGPRGGKQKTA
ncbi:MAG: glycosyltransferase [Sphingomonadaceae bacterium]